MVIPRQDITDTSTYYQIYPSQKSPNDKQTNVSSEILGHTREENLNKVHSELYTVFKKSQVCC